MHNLELFAKNGLDKCAKGTFKRGILVHSAEVSLDTMFLETNRMNQDEPNVHRLYIARKESDRGLV